MGPHGSRDQPRLLRDSARPLPFGVRPTGLPGCSFKCTALLSVKVERRHEQLERFFVRRAPHPALERADPINADPGAFG
jgi:hypothetical protein